MSDVDALTNEQISFVGETLGPLFLNDPKTDADVTEPLIRAFATLDANAAAAEWPFAGEAALRSLTDMRDGAASAIEGGADALIWEYRRLLVGPGRKPAPPWGSVYTDRECVVFGASTLALRAWMREHGTSASAMPPIPRTTSGTCSCSWRGWRSIGPICSSSFWASMF